MVAVAWSRNDDDEGAVVRCKKRFCGAEVEKAAQRPATNSKQETTTGRERNVMVDCNMDYKSTIGPRTKSCKNKSIDSIAIIVKETIEDRETRNINKALGFGATNQEPNEATMRRTETQF